MKFGKNKRVASRLGISDNQHGKKQMSKAKKIGLITGVSAVALTVGVLAVNIGFSDKEITEPNDVIEQPDFTDGFTDDGFGDISDMPITEDPNIVDIDLSDLDEGSGTISEDGEQLMGSLWYSLDENPASSQTSTVGSTSVSKYGNVMQRMANQYTEDQKRKAEANKPQNVGSSNTSGSSNSSSSGNSGWFNDSDVLVGGTNPTPNNTGSQNNSPNDVIDNTQSNTTPITDKISLYINNPSATTIADLNAEGVDVVEGSQLKNKLFDKLGTLTGKLIIDTKNQYSENEILRWITDDYPNKLLVKKLDYGYLEEEERFLYIEPSYHVTKLQKNEINKWALNQVKSINAPTVEGKINQIADIIAKLGSYKSSGTANIHSPYTLFKKGYGVCQAYTSLGTELLNAVGIKNGIATGILNDEAHTWNVIEIGGKRVHVDFTLYDSQNHNRNYLNILDANINNDRVVNNVIY